MSSSVEDQQYVVKHFNTEPYQKLKRWHQRSEKDQGHSNKNSFSIDFFYLNVEYECRAVDFLRPAFKQFPFAEYAFIRLPHSVPDHALLSKFQYVPLKQVNAVPQQLLQCVSSVCASNRILSYAPAALVMYRAVGISGGGKFAAKKSGEISPPSEIFAPCDQQLHCESRCT